MTNLQLLSKEERSLLYQQWLAASDEEDYAVLGSYIPRALLTLDELDNKYAAASEALQISRQKKLVEALKEIERLSWELGEQSPPAVRAVILSVLREIGEGDKG